jgi:hypothetical protein
MSQLGLGRVKTRLRGDVGLGHRILRGSGHDRGDQRLDPDDVHNSGQIIGEDREGHLGGYLWERFGQEVRRPMRAFIVPNGCSTVSRRCRMACDAA